MAETNRRFLKELLKKSGNDVCAECRSEGPEWASYNIGVFICTQCAGFHRNMGCHISKVKSLKMDNWDDAQVQSISEIGNLKANEKYEMHVPVCYKRPTSTDDPQVLREQWVRAKYEREEFIHIDRQTYLSGNMEGYLWKRGREDCRFQLRKFVLSEVDDVLKYYVKDSHKEPKASMKISELNATFCPGKIGNLNGLQITYVKDGSTRNTFLYAEDGKDIVDWFTAIRSAKLNRLQVAFPGVNELELIKNLTRNFPKEGWVWKRGPRSGDTYKKRWFTLDDRKLMYLIDPLDAYPKGEIFLGYRYDGFAVKFGIPPGNKELNKGFTLKTPDRMYLLSAESDEDRQEWITILQKVIDRPLCPQDNASKTLFL
ncbi:Arf-GAP with dual PH domain-containing protein 1 [Nymphon striatum]|nr:Arf-GAP with dual PH domain-containing protein 1 [Nymphon striatum]